MWIEFIFYLAFLTQILLGSYHYPKRILERMDYVFEHYPADTYTKLYPKGLEKTIQGKSLYKLLNIMVLLIGLIVFVAVVTGNQQGNMQLKDLNLVPIAFGMVQAIPYLMLEISTLKQFKIMRNLNEQTKRMADLSPRHLFNYVSPLRFFGAVFMFILCLYVMFSLNEFSMSFDIGVLSGSMILCNGLFVVLGYMLLSGKKLDPHQSPKDRQKMTRTAFSSYTSVSILVSIYFIINRCVEHYFLDDWEPLLNCLYWLSIMLFSTGAMLKFTNLKDINFEVYKTSTSNHT